VNAADDPIQALLDHRDISRGLAVFSRLIDDRCWDRLGEVFAADVVFDYGTGSERSGLDALRATMAGFLDGCGGTQHLIGSILIDLDGDRATSRAYVQARHQAPADPCGEIFDSSGEYIDAWARRPEGWRIVRRDVRWMTHTGAAAIIGMEPGQLA